MVTTKGNVTIKPCILVSLHSSVTGGVSYTRKTLDAPKMPDTFVTVSQTADRDDRDVERWETTKIVEDKAEHERAEDARKKARSVISKLCIKSAFGLICPIAYESELSEAIESAHATVTGFNDDPTTRYTRVSLFVMRGHVAATDEEAAKAIGDEVRRLVAQMDAGIGKLDVEAIREAASKARALAATLSDEQSVIVSEAVKAARKAANTIAKRIDRDGEIAAVVVADIQRGAIEKARMAFLDLDDTSAPVAPDSDPAPVANVQRVAGLDLDDEGDGNEGLNGAASAEPMTALIFRTESEVS
jgi:hypothetical protein